MDLGPNLAERLARLYEQVTITDTCHIWNGSSGNHGYGFFYWGSRRMMVHRFIWVATHGEIPAGLEIDHLCRNRKCVRLDHMELVTHRENVLRSQAVSALNAQKTHCQRGHEFTTENTRMLSYGSRRCITCEGINRKHYRALKQTSSSDTPP